MHRTIYISNKKHLKRLDKFIKELREFCVKNTIAYDIDTIIYFKVLLRNQVKTAVRPAKTSIKALVNHALSAITREMSGDLA